MYKNIELKHSLDDIVNLAQGKTIALHGGRFISCVIASELDKHIFQLKVMFQYQKKLIFPLPNQL